MTPSRRAESLSRSLVCTAGAAGAVHAGFSLYWALGGEWLLGTVGQWAVRASADTPVLAGLALGCIAVVKLIAAAIPIAVVYGRLGHRRVWRAISWVGGLFLVAYGGANIVLSWMVLGGAIRPEDGFDRDAMLGHAYLWDPLFLVWGAALVLSLALSVVPRAPGRDPIGD